MIIPCRIQNALDLVALPLRPLPVHRSRVIVHGPVDREQAQHHNALFVDDIELVADRGHAEPGAGGEDGGLGRDGFAREGVEDGVGG